MPCCSRDETGEFERANLQRPMPEPNLFGRVVSGTLWLYGARYSLRGLALLRTAVLARILVPADFGLVGIALLIIAGAQVFAHSGLRSSIVQKQDVVRRDFDVVWTFELLRATAVSLLMLVTAPLIALFFGEPASLPILRALSVMPVLAVLPSIMLVGAEKELKFKKLVSVEFAILVADTTAGIALAFALRSAWALVGAMLAGQVAQIVMSYIVARSRPRLAWDWPMVKRHFGYGRQEWAVAWSSYLYNNGDDWFVGKMLGTSLLGLYRMAYRIGVQLPVEELALTLHRVLFPAFATLQNRADDLRQAFLMTQRNLSMLVAPIAAFIFFFAPSLVEVLLGDQWLGVVPALRVLVWWGVLGALRLPIFSLLSAKGRPILVAYSNLAKLALLAVLLWPALEYGLPGIAGAVLLTSVLEFPVATYFAARQLGTSSVALLWPTCLTLAVAAAAAFGVSSAADLHGVKALLLGVVGTGVIYLSALALLSRLLHLGLFAEWLRIWRMARQQVRRA